MAPARGLLPLALLVLSWQPSMAGAQGTVPLQTLRCHNDYTSRIVCRWADTQDARRLVNVTLYRRLNGSPLHPVSCELSDNMPWADCPSPDCVPRRCVIPYNLFVVADKDSFLFQPDRPLGTQLTVILAKHVQPPTPTDLRVRAAGDRFLLTWGVAVGASQSQWLSELEFEVAYRRLQDSWEDAATLYSTAPRADLGPGHLTPSSTYVARVRTRLGRGSGLSGRPSRWSPEVRWDSQPGDEAQPQNLQCFFDGAVLSCSWEVRSEVTSSVSFTLFYKSSSHTGEKECAPVLKEASGRYTQHRCQLSVADPRGQYLISVRPKKEEKCIRSPENIQMAPPTLNVTKGRDGYILRWEVQKMLFSHIQRTFEVQYKKDADSWEESKTESLQSAHAMALPPLQPSTRYQARVRVKPFGGYSGIWSEWSEERSWDTEWVLSTWGLALILVFATLILLPALRFCGVYGHRLGRKWEEKIPNPRKSQLFQGLPDSLSALASQSPSHKRPWGSRSSGLEWVSPTDGVHHEVSPLTIEDPKDADDSPSEPNRTPAAVDLPTELPPSPPPCPAASSSRPGIQVSSFDFNGPYLGPPHGLSLPGPAEQEVHPQAGASQKPLPAGSLEYLCLPRGEHTRLVPLARGAESAAPRPAAARAPPAPGPAAGSPGARDSPTARSAVSGGPEDSAVASGYVSTADLALAPPTGAPFASSGAPRVGLPPDQTGSLRPGLAGGPPAAPAPGKSAFDSYVELPAAMGQAPTSPLGSPAPAPAAAGSPVPSPGEPPADVAPVSPHPEGLLVLQQVGDYCFLPGVGSGPLSPRSKPCSPAPSPEDRAPGQAFPAKTPPGPAVPQVPAIQLFKARKQQDYLAPPPWDVSRPGEVC